MTIVEVRKMSKHYFAADGNYGSAEGLVVVDTSDWTDDEWAAIDFARDNERAEIAKQMKWINPDQQILPGFDIEN